MRRSAGILLFRRACGLPVEVLLVHPGGPLWSRKDEGAWQIPKGELNETEPAEEGARRETEEELGLTLSGALMPLARIKQKGGKTVEAFCLEHDLDPATVRSNLFEMEWPPKSGRRQQFPEVDRARWMTLDVARIMMLESQRPLLDALEARLGSDTVM